MAQVSGSSGANSSSNPVVGNSSINRSNVSSNQNAPVDNAHSQGTLQENNRSRAREGLARANANRDKLGSNNPRRGSSINDGSASRSNQSRSLGSNRNSTNSGRANQLKQQVAKEAIKKYAAAHGVPEQVTEKALESKKGQAMLQRLLDKKNNMGLGIPGMPGNPLKNLGKSDGEKSSEEKDNEDKAKEESTGDIKFEMNRKTLKRVVIITPIVSVILIIFVIFVAAVSNDKVSSAIVGQMSSKEDKEAIKNAHENIQSENGEYNISDSDLNSLNSGNGAGGAYTNFPPEFQERFKNLGNAFTTDINCSGKACYERNEFKYYLKIADIATRYKLKYNITLDWYLITATDLYFTSSQEITMGKNLGGYNESDVTNTSITTSLDWEYDYKNIPGYQYLDASNSQYDLQILAKNMVKKKTIQTCNSSNGTETKSQTDEDVEDKYFEVGGEKRLNCGSGESYNISSTYQLDTEKYKEFLLEYIDKKMYSYGTGSTSTQNNCVVNGDSFIWPVGSKDTTNNGGKLFAIGEPVSVQITSYFGSRESFRSTGHGAIDIAPNGNGPGVVNVVASKGGKVVYPTSKSQTSFADNGYIGNRDGDGYGNYVIIDHGDNIYTLYGHMAKDSITVTAGDTVSQGQVIGKIGNSGNSTGAHLHFEMRSPVNSYNNRIDPLNYVDPNNPRLGVSTNSCSNSNDYASKMVSLALAQINDPDAVNGKKYWSYLGYSGRIEWCAAFVSWVVNNTEVNGKKLSDVIPFKSASVAEWMNYFYNTSNLDFKYNDSCSKYSGKNGTTKYVPKAGDLIFFASSWNGSMPIGFANHIGIVQYVEGDRVVTIEGNYNNSVSAGSYALNDCKIAGYGSWY